MLFLGIEKSFRKVILILQIQYLRNRKTFKYTSSKFVRLKLLFKF